MHFFIQSPAPNYTLSLDFYDKISFTSLYSDDDMSIFSDGSLDIMIRSDRGSRLGGVAYIENFTEVVDRFKSNYQVHEIEGGYITADPNGVRLYLRPISELPELSKPTTPSILGRNFGFGIETVFMEASLNFWSLLGFERPDSEERSYVTMQSPDMPALTLFSPGMCPHSFYNPSLTYFNGKEGNPKVIQNLRKIGIKAKEEITAFNPNGEVDNIIINDPGGLHYFIFND